MDDITIDDDADPGTTQIVTDDQATSFSEEYKEQLRATGLTDSQIERLEKLTFGEDTDDGVDPITSDGTEGNVLDTTDG